tara:strand:+ start:419 stop:634 length:216 start_codon:yes stop_codon:yes gene_type:complete
MKVVMLIPIFLMISLAGCGDEPAKYAETGLPSNCRALIAEAVKGWRTQEYGADEAMMSIDRNCGANGHLWK